MGGDKDQDWANDCDGDMDADGWKWPDRGQAGDHWSNWNDDQEEEQEPEETQPSLPGLLGGAAASTINTSNGRPTWMRRRRNGQLAA